MNHRNWKFQSQNVQIFGYVYQNTNGPNHGPAWKTQSSFLSEVCTVILWQDCCGKGNSRKFFWNTVGKEFQIGNAYLWTEKKDYSCLCMWTKKKTDWEETKHWPNVESTYKRSRFGRTNILPWPSLFGLHSRRECETSKDIVVNYRNMIESRISAGAKEKQPCSGFPDADISSWSYDVEGDAKKCVERCCELANKTTQQLYNVTTPCLDDHQIKEEELGFVGELSKICLHEQSPNGPELVTNAWLVCFFIFIIQLNVCNIVMWETLHNSADWDYFRTLILLEILKTQNRLQVNFVLFCKSHVCSHKLYVEETNFCFAHFNGIWDYLSWCKSTHGWNSPSWSLGFGYWSVAFFFRPT